MLSEGPAILAVEGVLRSVSGERWSALRRMARRPIARAGRVGCGDSVRLARHHRLADLGGLGRTDRGSAGTGENSPSAYRRQRAQDAETSGPRW